jgi:hypothetical protein
MKGLVSSLAVVERVLGADTDEMAREVEAYCETMGANCIAPGEGV